MYSSQKTVHVLGSVQLYYIPSPCAIISCHGITIAVSCEVARSDFALLCEAKRKIGARDRISYTAWLEQFETNFKGKYLIRNAQQLFRLLFLNILKKDLHIW